jgi:hypothetical protein
MLAGVIYRISPDSTKSKATRAVAVRVDPAAKFADQRPVELGEVTLQPRGEDVLVQVKTWQAEQEETAQLVLRKAHNGCGPAIVL